MTDEDTTILGLMPEQQARTLALKDARLVMRNSPFGSNTPDAMDLYYLAQYIITGEDPWTSGTTESPSQAVAGSGAGTATEAFRTDPEIAVNAVLDAIRIEVGRLGELGMVPLSTVLRAIEDARPVPDRFPH